MKKLRVHDCMTKNPVSIDEGTTLTEAYWLMMEKKVRRLPVMKGDRLVGIVTLEDLRRAIPSDVVGISPLKYTDMLTKLPVRQLMTRDPETISPSASLSEAASVMLTHRISALPVLEGDKLVGIITESDIFRVIAERGLE